MNLASKSLFNSKNPSKPSFISDFDSSPLLRESTLGAELRHLNDRKKTLITYDECVEKLVLSKLKCYYCLCDCILVYQHVREKKQWTLDRIDNDIDHSNENTVICCLECNLKKRTTTRKKK